MRRRAFLRLLGSTVAAAAAVSAMPQLLEAGDPVDESWEEDGDFNRVANGETHTITYEIKGENAVIVALDGVEIPPEQVTVKDSYVEVAIPADWRWGHAS